MNVAVLGAGRMGTVIAKDLADSPDVSNVIVGDVSRAGLDRCAAFVQSPKLSTAVLDVSDRGALIALMTPVDVVAGALPHAVSFGALEAAIEAKRSLVDLTGSAPERRLALDERAKEAGITILPGCGVAPGLSNILTGHGVRQLDRADEAVILVGGLPQHPTPPLGYRIVFSLESVLASYTKPAKIIQDGQLVEVPSLSGLEPVEFEGIGVCEAFYTDGLATLMFTMPKQGLRNVAEKTVRYPGHAERIIALRECGLLGTDPIMVEGTAITPRRFLSALLTPVLELGEDKDLTVMRVTVTGTKDGGRATVSYEMVDYYDDAQRITSMAKTTAYPCSIACQMIARGDLTAAGVVPVEEAFTPDLFHALADGLARRGVQVRETVTREI
ncbi:MAG: saccharopine dehydrogenase family protein [Candidatus Latescibacteria bacterium]|nr:saccharopine dehydrogenase family protein [Candidatus Latescibacterota bacterium]